MRSAPSATVLVVGLLGALGAAWLAATLLAEGPPRARLPAAGSGGVEAAAKPATPLSAPLAKPRKPGAYEVLAVENGGTIRVFCKLAQAAEIQQIPLNKDQQGCGHAAMPSERCLFDPATLGLANCIASLTDIQKGKDFEGELAERGRLVVFDHKQCRYLPHVLLLRTGQQAHLRNSDGVQHNVHAFFKGETKFNEMLSSNSTLPPVDTAILTQAGLYPVKCDIHYWMSGFILAMRHPYHAVSGADGRCELTNVPPGQYRVGCWHEGMRMKLQMNGAEISGYDFSPDITLPEQVVTVPPGGTVDVTFTFEAK